MSSELLFSVKMNMRFNVKPKNGQSPVGQQQMDGVGSQMPQSSISSPRDGTDEKPQLQSKSGQSPADQLQSMEDQMPQSSISPKDGTEAKPQFQQQPTPEKEGAVENGDNAKRLETQQVCTETVPMDDSDGIVTQDMRFVDDEDTTTDNLAPCEPPKTEDAPKAQEVKPVSECGVRNEEAAIPKEPQQMEETHPDDNGSGCVFHFRYEHDEAELRGEVFEVYHPTTKVKPKLRKCCDCCSRHRIKSSVPMISEKAKKTMKTKSETPKKKTEKAKKSKAQKAKKTEALKVAKKAKELDGGKANGSAPVSSISNSPQQIQCPACMDPFNVFVCPADMESDDTITTTSSKEWKNQTADHTTVEMVPW